MTYYPCDVTDVSPFSDVLDFFSEVAPCGVVGSFLLDKTALRSSVFQFKHHYITGALDSEILCLLLEAMGEKKNVTLVYGNRRDDSVRETDVVPLRIMQSVGDGRQSLMAYVPRIHRITSFRLDRILTVTHNGPDPLFDVYRAQLDEMQKHMWGVSTKNKKGYFPEHVDFTVTFSKDEMHIPKRLEREKRCGTVEYLSPCSCRFSADVYDAAELVPWIRTFICRITEIHFSDESLQKQFILDLQAMYDAYGIREGGDA